MSNPQSSHINTQPSLSPLNFNPQFESIQSSIRPMGMGNDISEAKLKQHKEKIKSLKNLVKAYQFSNETQSKQISSLDSLYIEYSTLIKKYNNLERDYNQLKAKNNQLETSLQSNTNTINEFQQLTKVSSDKFRQFESTNNELIRKLHRAEGSNEALEALNSIQKQKLLLLESQYSELTNKLLKAEESNDIKIETIEKERSIDQQNHQKELIALTVENGSLKTEIDKLKYHIEEIEKDYSNKEKTYLSHIEADNKEIEGYKAKLLQFQQDLNNQPIALKETSDDFNHKLLQSQNDLKAKVNEIKDKNGLINQLNDCLSDYSIFIKSSETALKDKDITIKTLTKEKEKLEKELTERKNALADNQSKSKSTIDSLNVKVQNNEDKLKLFTKDNEELKQKVKDMSLEMAKVKEEREVLSENSIILENQLKENIKSMKANESDYINQIKYYKSLVDEKEKCESTLKSKYVRKIKMLKLSNCNYETRVNSLMQSLISLKQYANEIERSIHKKPSSTYVYDNSNQIGSTMNINDNNNDNTYSLKMISSMKELIARIDTKLLTIEK